jgi:dihydrolipoamide dehydrogenase
MSPEQVREVVLQSLRRIAPEVNPDDLDPDQDLREQADLDSLDFFNFLVAIGKELGIEIPDADAPRLTTLSGCVAYLTHRTGSTPTVGDDVERGPTMNGSSSDLLVLGGGPGGYVAALRAAQLGYRVTCVEADRLGGVCGNWGCIPTKALLESAGVLLGLAHLEEFGIRTGEIHADLEQAVARSRGIADRVSDGVAHLFRKHGIRHLAARGRIVGRGELEVADAGGDTHTLEAPRIVIATGARPRDLARLPIDHRIVWDSTDAMLARSAPRSLLVLGAGAVGCEFADIFAAFGSRVFLLEALERILPLEDHDCSAAVRKSFARRGIEIHTGIRLSQTEIGEEGARVGFHTAEGEMRELEVDRVLSAVGRVPNVEEIGIETVGVRLDERGFIAVDRSMRTSAEGFYAVGDVAGPPLLAHKAFHEGIACVESIHGLPRHAIDYANIPNCTYSHPEVASVGLTEEQARARGREVEVGTFPWRANGRALTVGETEGFVKVVRDCRYSEILGTHIVGPHASELIAEAVLARHLEATTEQLASAIHPHPTLSEAVGEAALVALGQPLHL